MKPFPSPGPAGSGGGGGGDTPLAVGDCTHFWRLSDTSPHADIGSAAHVNMTQTAHNGGTWLYHRKRLYQSFEATYAEGPVVHDSMIADLPSTAASWSVAFTCGVQRGSVDVFFTNTGTANIVLAKFHNPGDADHVTIFVDGTNGFRLSVAVQCGGPGGNYGSSAVTTLDWLMPHRILIQWDAATWTIKFAIDGIVITPWVLGANPTFTGLSQLLIGGKIGSFNAPLLYADVSYRDRVLTDAEILADGYAAAALY